MNNPILENIFSTEKHPWNWHIPKDASKLLIGTFPTEEGNRKHDFFYCSATNRFWNILSSISSITIRDEAPIDDRKLILKNLKLGLTDVGGVVYRQKGSSSDHSLFPVEFMDLVSILKKTPHHYNIYFFQQRNWQ